MKVRCIQTCVDCWPNDRIITALHCPSICFEGEDYFYNIESSTNNHLYIISGYLKLYGVFEIENFITLAEWRERQINSILD